MKTTIALRCTVAVGCKQSPIIQQGPGYATMIASTSEKTLSNSYSASIRGEQDIDVYLQVSDFITKLCVTEGENVKKGQVLFIIDQIPCQAALNTAIADTEAVEASVTTAQLTYDSKQELYKNKVVSRLDLETTYNTLFSAKARLAQAGAREISARSNLSYAEVKSPPSGVIGTLFHRVGALVSTSLPKPLIAVSGNSEMYVHFSMAENQLLALTRQYDSKGKASESMPEIEFQLSDKSLYPQTGEIETINGVTGQNTGTASLRAISPNEEQLLNSGGSGSVTTPVIYDNCVVIPQAATFEIQDRVFVFKVAGGKAQSVLVEVVRASGGQECVINAGLDSGDVIVAESVGLLCEGAPIEAKQN